MLRAEKARNEEIGLGQTPLSPGEAVVRGLLPFQVWRRMGRSQRRTGWSLEERRFLKRRGVCGRGAGGGQGVSG